jgi:Flp pilus assembly protein TadB
MSALLVTVLALAGCAALRYPRLRYGQRAVAGTPWSPGAAASAGPEIADPALMLDLVGSMLAAGSPPAQALRILGGVCDPAVAGRLATITGALNLGADWNAAWRVAGPGDPGGAQAHGALEQLRTALSFAGATGAPSAGIIHARAAQLRRRRNREQEKRAAALGVRLVVPLGVCALPAFICLSVVPVLLALLPGH